MSRRHLAPGNRLLRPENGRPEAVPYVRPIGLDEPWQDERCGTYAGWNGHKYLGEEPCRPCKNAQAAYVRELRRRKGQVRWVVSVTDQHRQEALSLAVSAV